METIDDAERRSCVTVDIVTTTNEDAAVDDGVATIGAVGGALRVRTKPGAVQCLLFMVVIEAGNVGPSSPLHPSGQATTSMFAVWLGEDSAFNALQMTSIDDAGQRKVLQLFARFEIENVGAVDR